MKSPCEEIVWEVLPSIRAAIAEELIGKGLSQREVSRMLGISPPAVSQYVSKKRGCNMELGDEAKKSIEELADDLIRDRVDDLVARICGICRIARDEETACGPERCKF
jgi:predicted transcriptional regulator